MKTISTPPRHGPEAGFALLTVMVFAVVILISGVAFFALASYETNGAIYRQDSNEAFYLADGAVERARAKFLEDITWRGSWSNEAAGHGHYDLAVRDTSFMGEDDAVQLLAQGRVGRSTRNIEVMARLSATAMGLSILVMGDADVEGAMCLDGDIHVIGDADFGPHDAHLQCGEYTSGFEILPPPIYTEAAYYPEATYYDVRGNIIAGVPQARIFNGVGVDITSALGDSLVGVTTYDSATKTFGYSFTGARVAQYFDDSLGVFRRSPGDRAVIVNFGNAPVVSPPGVNGISNLVVDGVSSTVHATLINSRFTGASEEQRIDSAYWMGGITYLRQATFAPYYGIALIAYDFQKTGGALTYMGSEEWPALVYITNDVVDVNSNFVLVGCLTVLGDWHSTGGPEVTWDPSFLELLPTYLTESWPAGTSGTLQVLRWRELASP
jgi:hypothetical protein